jgi:O-antigen/teichoic acid export membrane protein
MMRPPSAEPAASVASRGARLGLEASAAARRAAGRLVRPGAASLLVSMVAVQGVTYAAQFVLARVLGPAEFGVVRSVEAALGFLLIGAALGMPSLVLREVAAAPDGGARVYVLRRLSALSVVGGVLVACVALAAGGWLVPPAAAPYLRALAVTLALTAASRTLLNYFQAVGRIGVVSVTAIAGAVGGMTTIVVGALAFGLAGWAAGRAVSEALVLALVLSRLRGVIAGARPEPYGRRRRAYAADGGRIAGALLVRSVLDSFALLAAGHVGVGLAEVGRMGLATLLTMPLLLVPGVAATLWIPELAAARAEPALVLRTGLRMAGTFLGYCAAATVAAWVIVPPVLRAWFPGYAGAAPLFGIALLTLPARVVAYVPGAICLGLGLNQIPLISNLATFIVAVAAGGWLAPRYGASGLLAGAAAAEWGGALLLCVLTAGGVRRQASAEPARLAGAADAA